MPAKLQYSPDVLNVANTIRPTCFGQTHLSHIISRAYNDIGSAVLKLLWGKRDINRIISPELLTNWGTVGVKN